MRPRRRIRIVFVFPQTPGAFVKFIFYVVGVDAHIDPPETPVLWRFSGESVVGFDFAPTTDLTKRRI